MKHKNFNQILGFLNGELSPEENKIFRNRLEESPALRAEVEELRALQTTLRDTLDTHSEEALRPFFTDRLMRRVNAIRTTTYVFSSEEEFFRNLTRLFKPIAVASLVIILSLAAYNFTISNAYEVAPSPTEAVLGLPPVDLATAYDLDFYQSRTE